jgi:hypothetical protein
MNYRKSLIASLMTLGIVSFAYQTTAQDMDVDQADTIDFQSFHKDKKEAVKVWDKKNGGTTKAYEEKPATSGSAASSAAPATATPATGSSAKAAAPVSSTAVPAAAAASSAAVGQTPPGEAGKRFEIRERYTLTRSTATPYSAFYVIEPLYKQSAQLCPRGWKKLVERSEPVEQDYYLYYEIECL